MWRFEIVTCPLCQRDFVHENHLYNHVVKHHAPEYGDVWRGTDTKSRAIILVTDRGIVPTGRLIYHVLVNAPDRLEEISEKMLRVFLEETERHVVGRQVKITKTIYSKMEEKLKNDLMEIEFFAGRLFYVKLPKHFLLALFPSANIRGYSQATMPKIYFETRKNEILKAIEENRLRKLVDRIQEEEKGALVKWIEKPPLVRDPRPVKYIDRRIRELNKFLLGLAGT